MEVHTILLKHVSLRATDRATFAGEGASKFHNLEPEGLIISSLRHVGEVNLHREFDYTLSKDHLHPQLN